MLTTEQINKLSTQQKQAELNRLASEYFETNQWKKMFAEHVGMSEQGIQKWFKVDPPHWPLLLLSAMCENKDIKKKVNSFVIAKQKLDKLLDG